MTTSLAPNPCLVAILLVIRTRAGPKVVFHYPADPSLSPASSGRNSAWYGASGNFTDVADSSESDASSDSDNAQPGEDSSSRAGSRSSTGRGSGRRDAGGSLRSGRTRETGTAFSADDLDEEMPERSKHDKPGARHAARSEHGKAGDHDEEQAFHNLLGFGLEGLAKLLAPGRVFHKRRFEFGVEHLVFVGAPRFVREDGSWKKKRRPKRHTGKDGQDVAASASMKKSLSQLSKQFEEVPAYGAAYGHSTSEARSEAHSESHSLSSGGRRPDTDLTMFNVIFVMNPPALEYSVRVHEMYDNVIKKFAKALKYAQAMNDYVEQESRAILLMRDKGREKRTPPSVLWSAIAQNSSLARAIMVTFNTISDDKIAHVNLGRDFDASFQLPQPLSISSVATPLEPQMPGLWLTTATQWEHDESDTLSPHLALLLLEDDDVLLKEVESDAKELSGPLSHFVRNLTPEKSLLKIAQKSSLSIHDVQLLARHLIYWRRGRAIPPLRQRDVYIVSPNADMRKLKSAVTEFAARFPTLQSLPSILNMLSGTPRPWATLFPSRDHRATYMRILAWLMRNGWVTQLRTFGWIRITADIKTAAARRSSNGPDIRSSEHSIEIRSSPYTRAADATTHGSRPQSQHDAAAAPRASSVASDSASASSGQTAITVVPPVSPLPRPLTTTTAPSARSSSSRSSSASVSSNASTHSTTLAPSSPALRPATSTAHDHSPQSHTADTAESASQDQQTASIIPLPQSATPLELTWIEQLNLFFAALPSASASAASSAGIHARRAHTTQQQKQKQQQQYPASGMATTASDDADADARELWPLLLKYFDGKHAFEEIYLREGVKKQRVAAVLGWLVQRGWLLTVRHW